MIDRHRRSRACVAAVVATAVLCACGGGGAGSSGGGVTPPTSAPVNPTVNGTRIDVDPFANPTSQHRTELEPSAFAFGNTIVAAFQTGRFFVAGSSDTDFSTSSDGGHSWTSGSLPGTTNVVAPGSRFDSVSDPVVTYDAKHAIWMILSLPIVFAGGGVVPAFLVNRSADGITWNAPIAAEPTTAGADKEWLTCDNGASSPHYGNCYAEWDDGGTDARIHVAVTSDGGLTWGPSRMTADSAIGIGGQPLVRPDGTVIIPIDDGIEASIFSFTSNDGGTTWSARHPIATISDHFEAGNLRSSPLPSAAIDGNGTVYVVWQDCRFRVGCSGNDIVFSTTVDGTTWSAPARIPLGTPTDGADHFLVGLGADRARPGRLGLTYYGYDASACSAVTCRLSASFTASSDGGASWSAPVALAGPIALDSLPQTTQGVMIGDYFSTVYAGGAAVSIFASANARGAAFDESMFAGVTAAAASDARSQLRVAHESPLPGARSDHPRRPPLPPD